MARMDLRVRLLGRVLGRFSVATTDDQRLRRAQQVRVRHDPVTDRSGPRIAHQGLVYPSVDLTTSSPSIDENASAPILSKADCLAFRDHHLGGRDPRAPHASPLFAADHSGLPPAPVQVAEHDPIRDDGCRYAEALQAAGVPVRLTQYVGMPHGFLAFPRLCRSAPQALAELCAEQAAALAPVGDRAA